MSKREAIRKMLERDSKNRRTFRKMCPLRKGHRKRSLREDMITVLPPRKRMAVRDGDEISCSLSPLEGKALENDRFHVHQERFV